MFEDELMIGSIRAQANHLKEILSQIENDETWKAHRPYYAREMLCVEKNLRKIRKMDFEHIYSSN